jgi:hypothetical protein
MRTVYRIIGVYCALVVGGMIAAGKSSNMPLTPWQALKQSRYVKPALGVAGVLTAAALTALLVRSHQKSSKNNEYPEGESLDFTGMSTPVSAASTPFHSLPASPKAGQRFGSDTSGTDDDQEDDDDGEVILDFSHLSAPVAPDISPEDKDALFIRYLDRYLTQDPQDPQMGHVNQKPLYSGLYSLFERHEARSPFSAFFTQCTVLPAPGGVCLVNGADLAKFSEVFKTIPYVHRFMHSGEVVGNTAFVGFCYTNASGEHYCIGLIENGKCRVFGEGGVEKTIARGQCFLGNHTAEVIFCFASPEFGSALA